MTVLHSGCAGMKEVIVMIELTEREEQEMIDRAKAGDPAANYDMSLWALDRAQEDPEDERWNRLAAKCLVRSAEAGYAPARERMQALLHETESGMQPEPEFDPWAEPEPAPEPAPAARQERVAQSAQKPPFFTAAAAAVGVAAHKIGSLFSGGRRAAAKDAEKPEADAADGLQVPAKPQKTPFFRFSEWDDARWRTMRIVCIVICVILAILIAVMLITRRRSGAEAEADAPLPSPETVETVVPSPTPEPVVYPDQDIRDEIAAANLEVFPAEEDYVSEATTATVNTSSGLNLRRGPGQSYGQIVLMGSNSSVEVYAYKNSWALVRYNGDTWGWCSTQYLK